MPVFILGDQASQYPLVSLVLLLDTEEGRITDIAASVAMNPMKSDGLRFQDSTVHNTQLTAPPCIIGQTSYRPLAQYVVHMVTSVRTRNGIRNRPGMGIGAVTDIR